MRRQARAALLLLAGTCHCWMREPTPAFPEGGAAFGHAPPDFELARACEDWEGATSDLDARKHTSFPELDPAGCFVPVSYSGGRVVGVGSIPDGCGFPIASSRETIERRAAVYEAVARGDGTRLPLELACELSPDVRAGAARHNAATLRSYAATLRDASPPYAYATISIFGYGNGAQGTSPLLHWRPGRACVELADEDRSALGVNEIRAARAADAWHAGLAPLVTVSGGAVHSSLFEAFMLAHLLACDGDVPLDRVLLDPCADHTHTNVRNTGAVVASLGARAAYVVTDDFIQGDYLEEWTAFDLVGGSVDQRALRDFGHLLGSWRQASRGIQAGFWYTPYRFWADSQPSVRGLTCLGDVVRGE